MTESERVQKPEGPASRPTARSGVRSMTGFAQVTGKCGDTAFTLSLKSVNHRYLDISMRMPPETDALEMKLRRGLKEKLARGHVDLTLGMERKSASAIEYDREFVGGFLAAFRQAAGDFHLPGEPDLNVVLRLPGAFNSSVRFEGDTDEFHSAVLASLDEALGKLNVMRELEGQGLGQELRCSMQRLGAAGQQVEKLRNGVARAYADRIRNRLSELLGASMDQDRIMQEAAILAERSDIEEEVVRIKTHIAHFLSTLDAGGEVGKKLDFLLQELNRETNTLLSKTSGVSGQALNITEVGLQMKTEIERAREQVQNLE